jgi:hypothetical protein
MVEVSDGIPLRLPRASIKALVHDQAFCISLDRSAFQNGKMFFCFPFFFNFCILMFMFHGLKGSKEIDMFTSKCTWKTH